MRFKGQTDRTSEPALAKRPLFDHNSSEEIEDKDTLEAPYIVSSAQLHEA